MPDLIVASEYRVDTDSGLLQPVRLSLSPNRDARPPQCAIDAIILHGISLPPGQFGGDEIEQLFQNQLDWDAHPYFGEIRGMQVSAHLLIRRDGEVVQFVPFSERAWHAGASFFRGRTRCNDFSIGIELEGEDETPYDARQYTELVKVLQALIGAYPGLSARELAGHCDIAPGRKSDPGTAFDWPRLYDGLGDLLESDPECT